MIGGCAIPDSQMDMLVGRLAGHRREWEKLADPGGKSQVTRDQALKLAKAAAEKDLKAQANRTDIQLDDKPTIADSENAWAFTWQGPG